MTGPPEPLHIGRLLGETLRFIFTRPHLWLMAWVPGFLLSVIGGFWVWENFGSFSPQRQIFYVPSSLFFTQLFVTISAGLITPLIYRCFFGWKTSNPSALRRNYISTMMRGIPAAFIITLPFIGFILFANAISDTVWSSLMRFILIILTWVFWLMVHGLITHVATLSGDGDQRRSWRANLRSMRGHLRVLFFSGIPVGLISLGLMFIIIALVTGILFVANGILGFNWRLGLSDQIENLMIAFLFTGAYFTAALPFQVFHSAAHIRLLEINEGTALGTDVGSVFK